MWGVGCSAAIPMARRAEIASTQAAGAMWTGCRCRKETELPTHGRPPAPAAWERSTPQKWQQEREAGLGMLTMQRLPLPAAPLCLAPGLGKAAPSLGTERMEELLLSASHHTGSRHSRVAAWREWDANVCIAKETKYKLSSTPSATVAGTGLPYEDGAGLGRPGPHPASAEITAPGDAFTSCSGLCLSLQSSRQNRQVINSTLTAPSCPAWPQQQEETPMGPTPLSQRYPPQELSLHSPADLSPGA